MNFFVHEKDLWEITLRKLLAPQTKFGKVILERGTHKHHFLMKKNKLTCDTISINVFYFLLHHVAYAKNVKDVLYNICATFEN